mmetsp:Transcript_40568/g.84882  ORF Transcript_40568/g.84882 Transcript_40568/m.84882 type:complete len:202 (+) Transcript_40568:3720-4325(+)
MTFVSCWGKLSILSCSGNGTSNNGFTLSSLASPCDSVDATAGEPSPTLCSVIPSSTICSVSLLLFSDASTSFEYAWGVSSDLLSPAVDGISATGFSFSSVASSMGPVDTAVSESIPTLGSVIPSSAVSIGSVSLLPFSAPSTLFVCAWDASPASFFCTVKGILTAGFASEGAASESDSIDAAVGACIPILGSAISSSATLI